MYNLYSGSSVLFQSFCLISKISVSCCPLRSGHLLLSSTKTLPQCLPAAQWRPSCRISWTPASRNGLPSRWQNSTRHKSPPLATSSPTTSTLTEYTVRRTVLVVARCYPFVVFRSPSLAITPHYVTLPSDLACVIRSPSSGCLFRPRCT